MKKYNLKCNVGSVKYLVSFHDGIKTHSDGSEFYDIALFKNKKKLQHFISDLKSKGYEEVGIAQTPIKQYPMAHKDEENVPDGMYISLYHGFKNQEERELHGNWGKDGPLIGPMSYVHSAYQGDCNYSFENEADAIKYDMEPEDNLKYNKSCIVFDGMEYGDMTIVHIKNEKPSWYDVGIESKRFEGTKSIFTSDELDACIKYMFDFMKYKDNDIKCIFIDQWHLDEDETPMPIGVITKFDL